MAPNGQTGSDQAAPRWGVAGTVGWTILIAAVFVFVQTLVLLTFAQSRYPDTPLPDIDLAALESNGWMLALATVATTAVVLPLVVGIVRLRRGASVLDHLALSPVPARTMVLWAGAAIALMLASDVIKWVLGLPVAVDFVVDTYRSMGNPLVFLVALALLAPLTEELVFRGFMISGLQRSLPGSSGAVVVSSLLWAAVHLQYELYDMAVIFMLGCLLGASRIVTGSVYPAVAAHMAVNFFSYVLIGIYLGYSSN